MDESVTSLSMSGVAVEALIVFLISALCIVFSGVAKRTLTNFGVIRARRQLEDGQEAFRMFVEKSDKYFMTLYIMEMLSVIVMMAFGHSLFSHWVPNWAVWVILAASFLTFDLLIVRFFDLGNIAKRAKNLVRLLKPLCILLTPLTFILGLMVKPFNKKPEDKFADSDRVEEELEMMVDESTKQGGLEDIQGRIMLSAIDFGDTTVHEVMIPRTDIVFCDVNMTLEEALKLCVQEGYSRLPVYENDIDSVVGILYYKDLMKRVFEVEHSPETRSTETIRGLVREVTFVPETKHIQALFGDFQREHYHIAVVIDEFGGTAGIVTLEDILEEFFGEIQDEYDSEESAIVKLDGDGNTVQVDAKTNVAEIAEFFDVEFEENADFDTVGGLVTYKLGRVGTIGDECVVEGLRFRVTEANEKCILNVVINRAESETQENNEQI